MNSKLKLEEIKYLNYIQQREKLLKIIKKNIPKATNIKSSMGSLRFEFRGDKFEATYPIEVPRDANILLYIYVKEKKGWYQENKNKNYKIIDNRLNGTGIKDVEKFTKEIRDTSTKLPKKSLKLEGTNMKFTNLIELIKKAIEFKRKKGKLREDILRLTEEKKIVPRKKTDLSVQDKRIELKKVYKKILTGTPYDENISVFMKLIDQVPEDYLNYELGVDMGSAYKIVDELISGSGDLTQNELADIANIVSGIGIPAIEKHATGKSKLSKKTAKFGAEELSKSAQRVVKSMEQRRDPRGKIEAPKLKN